jgi:CRISPR-associated protein Cmr3
MSASIIHLTLMPRDPLIARDGRPFSAGVRMKSLGWFYPSVLAGSLRTLVGQKQGGFPANGANGDSRLIHDLKRLACAGPLPCVGGDGKSCELYVPHPADLAVEEASSTLQGFPLRPWDLSQERGGCDLPHGLSPAILNPNDASEEFKPSEIPAFWSCSMMASWLADARGSSWGTRSRWGNGYLNGPLEERRMHVKMNPNSGAGEDGNLFQTTGLVLEALSSPSGEHVNGEASPSVTLAARLACENDSPFSKMCSVLDDLAPMGGERRLVHWHAESEQPPSWACPPQVSDSLATLDRDRENRYVRMVLATPALFRRGWCPGWLAEDTLTGEIPGTAMSGPGTGVTVRLISAVTERWRPVSGWSYEQPCGPKPVRRVVPAGGVYFFEVLPDSPCPPSTLATRWLESVCDDEQDCRDGFGLALWGVWQPFKPTHTFKRSAP